MKQLAYCLICSALGVLHAGAGDCDLVVIGPIRTVSKAMPLAEGRSRCAIVRATSKQINAPML